MAVFATKGIRLGKLLRRTETHEKRFSITDQNSKTQNHTTAIQLASLSSGMLVKVTGGACGGFQGVMSASLPEKLLMHLELF